MKKLVIGALVAITVGGAFAGCGSDKTGTETSADQAVKIDVVEKVTGLSEKFPIRMPMDASEEDLKEVYGLNMDNIASYSMKQCGMTPGIDVMGIFEAKDGNVEDVKTDLAKILESKKQAAYLPQEMEALDNAKIVSNGNYVGIFLVQGEEEGANPVADIEKDFNAMFTK
ncbi:DUF4358 domain-containing protein [uncultured Clostridium sp.]|jgi:hypothetical protein|uniref:DUF4358 domain-containing protein n=1 Tax=uncultured Clostridium sp. TaxID=59620 RepID=UPI00261F9D1A|nr:DUF4358 domain-containing protein [uncultured Clostridium sp.]